MGGLGSLLGGGTKTYKADPLAGDINAAAKTGIGYMDSGASRLNNIFNQDPTQLVNNQIGMENKMLRGSTGDAERKTSSMLASRGLSNSSIGLGQVLNLHKGLNDKLALNNASAMSRIRDTDLQNSQGLMQTGQNLFNIKQAQGPIQMQDVKTNNGGLMEIMGALAPGIGAGVGSYLGKK
jgi:hypothetical protein